MHLTFQIRTLGVGCVGKDQGQTLGCVVFFFDASFHTNDIHDSHVIFWVPSGPDWELWEAKGPLKDHAYYDEILDEKEPVQLHLG